MPRYIDVNGYRKLFDEEYKKTRELIHQGETHLDNLAEGFCEAGRVIDSIPTADVVEVVRCKDCKWFKGGYLANACILLGFAIREPDEFCSRGERKEK